MMSWRRGYFGHIRFRERLLEALFLVGCFGLCSAVYSQPSCIQNTPTFTGCSGGTVSAPFFIGDQITITINLISYRNGSGISRNWLDGVVPIYDNTYFQLTGGTGPAPDPLDTGSGWLFLTPTSTPSAPAMVGAAGLYYDYNATSNPGAAGNWGQQGCGNTLGGCGTFTFTFTVIAVPATPTDVGCPMTGFTVYGDGETGGFPTPPSCVNSTFNCGGPCTSGSVVLPVELVFFKGKHENGANVLEWQTATEINNDFFLIQRSQDAVSWVEIAKVLGHGSSEILIDYEFQDEQPLYGSNYYRLKQVDYDGKFEYSPLILVKTGDLPDLSVESTFPNPTAGEVQINYVSNNTKPVRLYLYDSNGALVLKKTLKNHPGFNRLILYTEQMASGIYLLSLENGENRSQHKIIKE